MRTQVTIRGYLVGNIWMHNAECWKEIKYDVTHKNELYVNGYASSFRDHVVSILADSDFQSCAIAQGEVVITMTGCRGNARRVVTHAYPLSRFPSVADCLHDDWFPSYDDEE